MYAIISPMSQTERPNFSVDRRLIGRGYVLVGSARAKRIAGSKIVAMRGELGLSQETMAQKSGVDIDTIRALEAGSFFDDAERFTKRHRKWVRPSIP